MCHVYIIYSVNVVLNCEHYQQLPTIVNSALSALLHRSHRSCHFFGFLGFFIRSQFLVLLALFCQLFWSISFPFASWHFLLFGLSMPTAAAQAAVKACKPNVICRFSSPLPSPVDQILNKIQIYKYKAAQIQIQLKSSEMSLALVGTHQYFITTVILL